jgi:hypothetical protein
MVENAKMVMVERKICYCGDVMDMKENGRECSLHLHWPPNHSP